MSMPVVAARVTALLLLAAPLHAEPSPPKEDGFRVGKIEAEAIQESSGIVASRKHADVFWTINDSGSPPALYAITREGKLIREYAVAARNSDWEDLATDADGHLYIADVGNNARQRKQVEVFRITEPDPRAAQSGRPAPLRVSATWRLQYPNDPFDCESLFILDNTGYLLPKRLGFFPAEIYRFDLTPGRTPVKLQRVGELPAVRGPVTAADVSADRKRLAVLTVFGPHIIEIDGDVAGAAKAPAHASRYVHPQMEAACFVAEGLLVTTETREILLFRDEHFTP